MYEHEDDYLELHDYDQDDLSIYKDAREEDSNVRIISQAEIRDLYKYCLWGTMRFFELLITIAALFIVIMHFNDQFSHLENKVKLHDDLINQLIAAQQMENYND